MPRLKLSGKKLVIGAGFSPKLSGLTGYCLASTLEPMELSLDRSGGAGAPPLSRQIADRIRAEIAAGRLDAGERLPPIRSLARRLGVNRDTVALAYDALAAEGALEATVGRGTFVRAGLAAPAAPARALSLSSHVEGLLDFERARPRYGAGTDCVPLHSLVPEPSLYPVAAFRRSVNRVLERRGGELLLYGDRQGDPQLREVLARRFAVHGMRVSPDEITLCQGATQGIALALRLFALPGDAVAVEEPTYGNVLGTLRSLGLAALPVPMTDEGLDLDALEGALARPEVKLLYTIPTFHNPLGTSTGLAHRRRLLAIAARAGKPVVEDAYEMDLRFRGRPVPPLAALDGAGLVVHLYSFSKSLFPGARVGAVTARGRAVEGLHALRGATDLGGSPLVQAALADFVAEGAYDRHLARLRRTLRARTGALLEALAAEMPEGVRFTRPEGGYQVWVELPEGIDTRDLLADAMRAGMLFAPGSGFLHDGRRCRGLRLTVAQAGEARLRRGVAVLAGLVRERLQARARRSGTSDEL
jgi:DNA-binding transcriptional MocR family regulator